MQGLDIWPSLVACLPACMAPCRWSVPGPRQRANTRSNPSSPPQPPPYPRQGCLPTDPWHSQQVGGAGGPSRLPLVTSWSLKVTSSSWLALKELSSPSSFGSGLIYSNVEYTLVMEPCTGMTGRQKVVILNRTHLHENGLLNFEVPMAGRYYLKGYAEFGLWVVGICYLICSLSGYCLVSLRENGGKNHTFQFH